MGVMEVLAVAIVAVVVLGVFLVAAAVVHAVITRHE